MAQILQVGMCRRQNELFILTWASNCAYRRRFCSMGIFRCHFFTFEATSKIIKYCCAHSPVAYWACREKFLCHTSRNTSRGHSRSNDWLVSNKTRGKLAEARLRKESRCTNPWATRVAVWGYFTRICLCWGRYSFWGHLYW